MRRAFLCGYDNATGIHYEYRLLLLADMFAIDLCAYAVILNYVHTVLHIDTEKAKALII